MSSLKKIFSNSYFLLIIRVVLAFVFIYAGVEKIADPESFSKAIYNYKLFPEFTINFFAITIPWLEIICGVLLLFGIEIKANASIFSFLLLFFIVIILISLMRGLNIDCGCFGSSSPVAWNKIFENFFLLIGGILLILFSRDDLLLLRRDGKLEK